ncbi:creatininase family protein [Amycolatopsis endophytica]|uniref:Creatinine amidohydrolase n=1 Tax=Amycolatopsis endophytica TaxID=860233 RepID=A0A853BA46_9PSEU|nr:creatininase family protein [Amycolatopsis endophytica]NYI91286.1 creatinine amidohydrolase [Amycolatopsis endophytica]
MNPLPPDTTGDVRDREPAVAVLPVGSLEQHGPHLPLTTDTLIACAVAGEIAREHGFWLLPPVTVSCSHEHAAWPGTVSISATTLVAVVEDIAASLRASGVGKLVLVNGHGGNHVLANVVQSAGGAMVLFPAYGEWQAARAAAGVRTSNDEDMHAGELETSILLHASPDVVRPGYADADSAPGDLRHLLSLGLAPYTQSGVAGHPSRASAGKGRAVLAALTESFRVHLPVLGG